MTKMLTPEAAAKRVGTSRSAIMRALQAKKIRGIRDNSNKWQIDPGEVDRWASGRVTTDRTVTDHKPISDQSHHEISRLNIEVAVLATKLGEAENRLTELREERDWLRLRVDAPTGFWARIWGTRPSSK